MDDRILLVPASVAPDPAVFARWPAMHALTEDLASFLPIDTLLYPSLRGQPRDGRTAIDWMTNALRRQIRPGHHVLALICTELILGVLAEGRGQSLITTLFAPSAATASSRGDETLAGAMSAMAQLMASPSQFVATIMGGASEEVLARTAEEVERTLDQQVLEMTRTESFGALEPPSIKKISIPALYLTLPALVPGRDEVFSYFRSLVPDSRLDSLEHFGLRLHEEAGGHELADKVIPFIQEVIAARKSA